MIDIAALMRQAFAAYERDNLDEAFRLCTTVIGASPGHFDAHHLLAVVHTRQGREAEALASYDRALEIWPDHVQVLSNRGVVLDDLRRYEEALEGLEKAVASRPDYAPALSNRGNTLEALGRFEEALASYDRALAIQSDFADCRFNRAMLLLLLGRTAEGWREYEWRRKLPSWVARDFGMPEWQGEDLHGKRLLLYAEQGLGDTIQFARFAPLLAERGAEVILQVQPPLRGLLRSLPLVGAVLRDGDPLPPVDLHLPLMSVPFMLGVDEAQFAVRLPYLAAEPARVEAWSRRLPAGGFRVGVAWQGDPRRKIDRGRSIPLATFAPLSGIPGVRLVSLQKHWGLEQLAQLPPGMQVEILGDDLDAGPDGFLDTAAVIAQLDLVITSDSAVAHLAGALGRPVWIAVKDVPDWRWLLGRADSPWYPTARLFRQRRRDDWAGVLADIAAQLAASVPQDARQATAPVVRCPASEPVASAAAMASAFAAFRRGEIGEAERLCRAITGADASCFDAHHLLAVIDALDGRADEALAGYDRALALRPDDAQALSNRGALFNDLQRYEEGLASIERALEIQPDYAEALSNRGNALHGLQRPEEALASFDAALALRPDFPEGLASRGSTLHDMRRFEEALASCDRALAVQPDYALALSNRGVILKDLRRQAEALASFDKALAIRHDFADCHFNRAMPLLLLGRFAEGWRDYEWRRKLPSWVARRFDAPEWRGEELRGKRLLLYAEQGLGDTIQFSRFVPLLAERGAEVILQVQPALGGLMRTLPGVAAVVRDGEPLPAFDLHAPLLSVPFVLGIDERRIPASVPYLAAEPARVDAWAARLPKGGFRVGIAWQGHPRGKIDRGRSIPLGAFAPLAAIPGVRLISLQKHWGVEQLMGLPAGMRVDTLGDDFDAGPDGFLDTAAVMTQLDLVITSDSAIAHLAGALARPVWIALKDVPDWRWLLDRADSPWYPTARLFRQQRRDDWQGVFADIAAQLAALASGDVQRSITPAAATAAAVPTIDIAAVMQAAIAAYQQGQVDEAERLSRSALAADANCGEAHHLLAVILARYGRHGDAVAAYDRALELRPDDAQALSNRAVTLGDLGRFEEALASVDRALQLEPDYPPALSNRGNALRGLRRHEEALASYDRALALWPDFPEALSNRGNALHELGRYDEALASYDRALALRPDYPHALSNRGLTLQQLKRFGEALASFDRALALQPQYADCRCNKALLLLLLGCFAEGWPEYEWRAGGAARESQRAVPPLWQGEDLYGKRLLLRAEQGLGDTIQCARFAPLLAARGAEVTLEVQEKLGGLMQNLGAGVRIIRQGEPRPTVDLQLPLMSVPLALGIDAAGVPPDVPYLAADPGRIEKWRTRLPGDGFRVGIAWQGNPIPPGRAVPLRAFASLAAIPGVRLISLQKHDGLEQLEDLPEGMRVETLGDDFDAGPDGFLDCAAVMMQLDLVVTADSAVAHLAGALGRPVWILLADVPDWRWMLYRSDTPWYPSARLFRQHSRGDWDGLMRQAAAALTPIAQSRNAPLVPAPAAMPAYVISLPRRGDRRQRFLNWNSGKGLDIAVFDAVDGRALDRRELVARNLIADENVAFSAGAIGNALSHRALWQKCLERDEPIIVLEDDAYLTDGVADWIEPIRRELEAGCDIVYLGYNRDAVTSLGYGEEAWCSILFDPPDAGFAALREQFDRRGGRASRCIADVRLAWGTLAYAVAPRGVRALLEHCFPLAAKYPIQIPNFARQAIPYALDGVIISQVQRGRIKARAVFPPLAIGPNEHADSDVVVPRLA